MRFLERNIAIWVVLLSLILYGCSIYYTWVPRRGDELNSPQIVELIPADGSREVNPDLDQLIMHFDRPMRKGASATVIGGRSGIMKDRSYWNSPTECIFPVEMEENTEYTIWLNSDEHTSFVDKKGYALIPYKWAFTTGSGK